MLNDTFNNVNPTYKVSALSSISAFVNAFANIMIGVGISVSVITMTYSFVKMTTAFGDPKKTHDATYGVWLSVVGLLVSILALVLKNILFKLAGSSDNGITGI